MNIRGNARVSRLNCRIKAKAGRIRARNQQQCCGRVASATWINLKSAVTSDGDHTILAEYERGEDSAVEEYKKAIENGLSAPVREVVSRQYAEVKRAHDHIKNLRDTAKES
jgi:uncharacterized protein (TIGR02284 family)